jgi:hypothetical protein
MLFTSAKKSLDNLTIADTLEPKYFKGHFKEEWTEEAKQKDEDDNFVYPFDNPAFVEMCLDHATATALGFNEWVYDVYKAIQDSLSADIARKISSVRPGDIISLLTSIGLAICHFETMDPDDLDSEYTKASMEHDGENDIMMFLAVLGTYMRRLDTAGYKVADSKAQRVLLRGLNQEIFGIFIVGTASTPHATYDILERAVRKFASTPHTLAKLRALKPGTSHSVLATRGTPSQAALTADTERLDRMEAIMTTFMATNAKRDDCFNFAKGRCTRGDKCPYKHTRNNNNTNNNNNNSGHNNNNNSSRNNNNDSKHQERNSTLKHCVLHKKTHNHTTAECTLFQNLDPGQQAFLLKPESINSTFESSDYMCTTRVSMATSSVFTMQGKPKIDLWCVDGASTVMATWDISRCFDIVDCHVSIDGPNSSDTSFVCSKKGSTYIPALNKDGTVTRILATDVLISSAFPFHIFSEIKVYKKLATATKKLGAWQFYTASGAPLCHASQRLLGTGTGRGDNELYFIDEVKDPAAGPVQTIAAARALTTTPPKVNTAKNLELLLQLHCAHDHRNFADIARQYGLSLPSPAPVCWACILAKPTRISHDKVSTRQTSRPFESFAADAKGPISTPTPEGYRYFFVVVDLYSSALWVFLTKSQGTWKEIWPAFVKKLESKSGKERCVASIITDSHAVFTANDYKSFNDDRGIETINCSPHDQWQDPAERHIQTLMNAARTSMIHGGGKSWMWGWAILHARDAINRLEPSHPVPGHKGKIRICIVDPSMTLEKALRTLFPFLCLAMRTVPMPERGANFEPRAEPCLHLCYLARRKAYALLTLPALQLVYTVEVRHIPMTFPMRTTHHLANQLDSFLRPSVEDTLYSHVHGPSNLLRRQPLASPPIDPTTIVARAPVEVHVPTGYSSTRGYVPSAAALENAASINAVFTAPTYTPDQLAARTPRSTQEALNGPDAMYWQPAIKKDFAMLREKGCFINITDSKPPGQSPPHVEQRFKIKHRGPDGIALADLSEKQWKARTVARGDRFKKGEHYDATAAPVVHTPTLKVLVAYAVEKNLLLYQWDQEAAFYGNKMDREGVIVRLPPAFDPWSDELRPLNMPPLYAEMATGVPGIPQGSLLQWRDIAPALHDLGFQSVDADNCLFFHKDIDMATSLHVDDGILAAPSLRHAEQVLGTEGLGRTRRLTWSALHSTLGVDFNIEYTPLLRRVFMSQRAFAETILERANMLDCNAARTPATPGRAYTKADCPITDEQKVSLKAQGLTKKGYHSVTMSLNYLVMITRPDMLFVQGKMAKYCNNPGEEHFKIQKHALRYLKGTLDHGIEFIWRASDPPKSDGVLDIVAWTDSSFADDIDTGRTTIGDVMKVNGATVSASSRLSARVDSCVNHSELNAFSAACTSPANDELTDGASMALVRAARTVTWLRGIKAALERRDVSKMPPTPILVDNAGVISMLEGVTLKSANKHIYKTLAENRERVNLDKSVVAVKIDTKDNLANAMTKQEHGLHCSAAQLRQIAGPMSA